jgi:hypothetical protein
MAGKDVLAQSPGVSEAHMVDPALHARVELTKRDATCLVVVDRACQLAAEIDCVAAFDQPVGGVDDEGGASDASIGGERSTEHCHSRSMENHSSI